MPSTTASATKSARVKDITAGLSIAGLLLPEAIAYASIGNLPPQMGIIALLAGLVCYSLVGSSRFAIVSATSSSAAVLAAATASISINSGDVEHRLMLGVGLVIVTGIFFLLAGLARVGEISSFIAKPVLRGFVFGLAIFITLKQLPQIAGVHTNHDDLMQFLPELFGQIHAWNAASIMVGVIALGLLFLLSRFRRLPGALIVVVLGIACSDRIDLARYGVRMVGAISLQLPSHALPMLSGREWGQLSELGLALAMILYAESYSSIRSFAVKHGDTVSPNRDLLALGAANVISGLLHGMPVGAGFSATSANEVAGAATRFAGTFAAIVILVVVLTLLPAVALIPEPALAAIVIHAVSHTLNPSMFRPYFRWHRDRIVVIAAVAGVLMLGVMDGLLAAIAVSILMMLRRFSDSTLSVLGQLGVSHDFVNVALHPEAKLLPNIAILRPNEPLFFANVDRILTQARHYIGGEGASAQVIILSLEASPDLDSSSLEALGEFFEFLTSTGKRLLFARLKSPIQEILKRAGIPNLPSSSIIELSVDDAVQIALRELGPYPAKR
ncbi:SulP family inorganic anion transporter [Paralcaligenes ureilyticus]|uniref:High affinity sulfate transporter 1 n=1 Tax=Paralcaligenes ureilyticus TaxID=627131 RepID=A0A4R3M9K9_9BURK|nr:SulP family inorganic anion transporter [Paralcaligenes ureilyticus]TCT10120.1 high affinity sulfate transporter 1 [Paralcaligenes ureilyticus]